MTPPSTVMNSRNPRGGRSSLDLKVNSSILRRYEGPSASRFGPVPSRAKPWRSERRRPTAHKGTDGIAAPIGWRSCRLVFHPCFDRGHRICARRHDHDRQWQATCGKQVSNSTVAAVARRRKFHALASVTTTVIVRSLLSRRRRVDLRGGASHGDMVPATECRRWSPHLSVSSKHAKAWTPTTVNRPASSGRCSSRR